MKTSFWYLPAGCLGSLLFLSGCTVDTAALASVIDQVQSQLETAKTANNSGTGTGQTLVDDTATTTGVPQTGKARPESGMARPGGAPQRGVEGVPPADGEAPPDAAMPEPADDQAAPPPAGRPRPRR